MYDQPAHPKYSLPGPFVSISDLDELDEVMMRVMGLAVYFIIAGISGPLECKTRIEFHDLFEPLIYGKALQRH